MRLIDADALLEELKESCKWHAENSRELSLLQRDINIVKEQPTVDAVPVRHGRWTADESTYTDGFVQCSVCKTTFYVDDLYCVGEKAQSELPNYCPHCGAKMTDGEHETD